MSAWPTYIHTHRSVETTGCGETNGPSHPMGGEWRWLGLEESSSQLTCTCASYNGQLEPLCLGHRQPREASAGRAQGTTRGKRGQSHPASLPKSTLWLCRVAAPGAIACLDQRMPVSKCASCCWAAIAGVSGPCWTAAASLVQALILL